MTHVIEPPLLNPKTTSMLVARAAMKESPRAVGAKKLALALDWIYRWGWASPTTIDLVASDGKRSGLVARLVKRKFINSTRTESGGGAKGIPAYMLTLTQIGVEEVERTCEVLIQYELNPYKIDQKKLRHDELAQKSTANSLKDCTISNFKTERELVAQSAAGVKQQDIIWITEAGIRIGIEIELSGKWDRKLDEFVLKCLLSIKNKKVDRVALVSDSKAILKRYEKAFKPGANLQIWRKNDHGFWNPSEINIIPEWIDGKFACILLS